MQILGRLFHLINSATVAAFLTKSNRKLTSGSCALGCNKTRPSLDSEAGGNRKHWTDGVVGSLSEVRGQVTSVLSNRVDTMYHAESFWHKKVSVRFWQAQLSRSWALALFITFPHHHHQESLQGSIADWADKMLESCGVVELYIPLKGEENFWRTTGLHMGGGHHTQTQTLFLFFGSSSLHFW